MPAKATFISFDADHDESLKNLLNCQAKYPSSPFSIVDWSIREPFDNNWQQRVMERMKHASVMAVICGQHTDKATGVSAEIRIAREEQIPLFLLRGYSDKLCVKPTAALASDTMYAWTWDNLLKLLNGTR